jgi:hypothetical protein
MRQRKFALSFVTWVLVFSGSLVPVYSDKVQIITDLGNVFTATTDDSSENNGSGNGNGQAMINGMGVNSRIINYDFTGKLNYGYGVSGLQSSLKTYNSVPSLTDFAAQLLETDPKTSFTIPKFNTEYQYTSSTKSLQQVSSTAPNILSYSQSRTVGGSAVTTVGSEGITISGTGIVILKLNSPGDKTLVLEGNVPAGSQLLLSALAAKNIFGAEYDNSRGFRIFDVSGSMFSTTRTSHSDITCHRGAWGYVDRYSSTYVFNPLLPISDQWSISYGPLTPGATAPTATTTGSKIQSLSQSGQTFVPSAWCSGTATAYSYVPTSVTIWDRDPMQWLDYALKFSSEFQNVYTFTGQQMYLVARPNGGTITIKGSVIDPATTPYLKITNLPPNTPFEILKDGFVASKGMSQYDGTVSLLVSDVNIGGASPSGTMYLYPGSLRYRGPFSTIVFDNINNQTIHIPTADHKVYVVHAYVQIPVVGSVRVDSLRLSGGSLGNTLGPLNLPYLDGNYTDVDLIRVPVIPGYHDIKMNINGIASTTVIANVLGGTGIKVAEPTTNTINDLKMGSPLSYVESVAGTSSYVISTTTGNINAIVLATISASSTIQNTVTLEAIPPPPPPPTRRDPLSAWVDVYRNGDLVEQKQLYFNDQPTFTPANSVSGNSQIQTSTYAYPQTTVSGTITVPAQPGDMIEYYLYAKIHAEGIALNPPSGFKVVSVSSSGTATGSIHSGSINTSY